MNHSGERVTATHVYFWNGVFSQWYISPFKAGDMGFNCAEQYMMARKALHFKDDKTLNEIMSTRSPRTQKAWGRKVKNFDEASWDAVKKQTVYDGTYLKFSQNETLKQMLLNTGSKTIVEASPYDKIWGVGLHFDDDDILDESKWRGENLLGKALMEVREELIKVGNNENIN